MNKSILTGRVTTTPEVRTTPKGTTVTTFDLAVQEDKNGQGKSWTNFIPIVAWGSLAELCGELKKGAKIMVDGKTTTRFFENRKIVEVVIFRMEYMEAQEITESEFSKMLQEFKNQHPDDEIPF